MTISSKHPIRVVSRKTGLSPHVIRAWERRHEAVSPERTPSNRRLYSDEDIERLSLLNRARQSGYGIGQIAHMTVDELYNLVQNDAGRTILADTTSGNGLDADTAKEYLENCIAAVSDLDHVLLEKSLSHSAAGLSQPVLMEQVLVPLMNHIGSCWREGTLRVAHEHMASAIIRTFLGKMNASIEIPESAPDIIVCTPSGQMHELGSLIVTATALSLGWRVTYLGPNLPAEDISAAVRRRNAVAVALSIIYPPDDSRLEEELRKLRGFLPGHVRIVIGGRSAGEYRDVLHEIGADIVGDIPDLRSYLEDLRKR